MRARPHTTKPRAIAQSFFAPFCCLPAPLVLARYRFIPNRGGVAASVSGGSSARSPRLRAFAFQRVTGRGAGFVWGLPITRLIPPLIYKYSIFTPSAIRDHVDWRWRDGAPDQNHRVRSGAHPPRRACAWCGVRQTNRSGLPALPSAVVRQPVAGLRRGARADDLVRCSPGRPTRPVPRPVLPASHSSSDIQCDSSRRNSSRASSKRAMDVLPAERGYKAGREVAGEGVSEQLRPPRRSTLSVWYHRRQRLDRHLRAARDRHRRGARHLLRCFSRQLQVRTLPGAWAAKTCRWLH